MVIPNIDPCHPNHLYLRVVCLIGDIDGTPIANLPTSSDVVTEC